MYCALHTIRRRLFCCSSGTILRFFNTAWVCAAPAVSHPALKVLPEQLIHCPHLLRQMLQGFLPQLRRHPVKGFGNAAGNAGKGIEQPSGILRLVPAQSGTHRPIVLLRQKIRRATPDTPYGRYTLRAVRMPGYISLFHASRCSTITRLSLPTWQSRNSTLTPAAFASASAVPNSG